MERSLKNNLEKMYPLIVKQALQVNPSLFDLQIRDCIDFLAIIRRVGLLQEFIPFLNADDDDLVSQANKIFKGYSNFKKPNFEELKKTQENMVSVLKVAWGLQKGNRALEVWLEESLNVASRYKVIWDSCENRVINELPYNKEDSRFKHLRYVFVERVICGLDGKTDIAKSYMGFCRRCEKLFRKEKKVDQVLCSNACKSAIYRDRKNARQRELQLGYEVKINETKITKRL